MVDFSRNYINNGEKPRGFMLYFYNHLPKRNPIVLNNIFFESDKSILLKESFGELNKLAAALLKTQEVIEIRGHTDNKGNEKKNQQLSEERAKAVVDYLLSKKINKSRLFYKGFGSNKPLVPNTTEEGRSKNRRVEFVKILY
jgi:outer membrane protein OmpA-like peptidoglycan-associated protein